MGYITTLVLVRVKSFLILTSNSALTRVLIGNVLSLSILEGTFSVRFTRYGVMNIIAYHVVFVRVKSFFIWDYAA